MSGSTGSFETWWDDLAPIGRTASGGYRRFAWTREDATLREWFVGTAQGLGLDVVTDRAGNLWAWWGHPDRDGPGVVVGSHLDSVPEGGAFDGPLGVVSSLAAVETLRGNGFTPSVPISVVCFGDEEGARFGIACAGSRLLTGALDADRARRLTDADGVSMAEAVRAAGRDPEQLGADPQALARVGQFVELHVEQGRALVDTGDAVGVGAAIWPHGRWRFDLAGRADHAGTTRLADRNDPMLALAALVTGARSAAERHDALATVGKVIVQPNGVNAIPSLVQAWLDARGPDEDAVRSLVADLAAEHGEAERESWTPRTPFDIDLTRRLSRTLGDVPVIETGAGHDAGVLAEAGVPTSMLFVRNPTGVSHSPHEHAELDDCLAGVRALTRVLEDLAS
ncbi:allantoate amidohydrolase [Angustibacter sp. Root456]|uniref:allantoate amidohydrolase n=1 Tax=Angustibacter sp. Root456 TaxID=1736539 RepID=UPI0006F4655A|nr:allantoate amidohydrolase [Angustibacter sp. Root456]KQX61997.1 Zn-dependent hydrolase [Angustibacter sp. Root456]